MRTQPQVTRRSRANGRSEAISRRPESRAIQQKIELQRRSELRQSLDNPHPASREWAELGFTEWARALPEENIAELVDVRAGKEVRWIPDRGWIEITE